MFGTSESDFPHKFSLSDRQVSSLPKAYVNYSATRDVPAEANTKSSKIFLSKMIQSDGFLGNFLGPLIKEGLPLMKNVRGPLVKNVLGPLG